MKKKVPFRDKNIFFNDIGQGNPIVLLHGYLESKEIWGDFAESFAKYNRVIAIDLPGHGETGFIDNIHSMEMMAESVKNVLDFLLIHKAAIIGHSMGGYVALAIVDLFPYYVAGFSLFHSSPFADTPDKREMRQREIEVIKAGKKNQLISAHFPKIFADTHIEKYAEIIEKAKTEAYNISDYAMMATLEGMKIRKDRSSVLKHTNKPFLIILGAKDNFIPVEIIEKIELPPIHHILFLNNAGHCGFIEDKDKSVAEVWSFVEQLNFD